MDSNHIYNLPTILTETPNTIEDMLALYGNATTYGNQSKIVQCCVCARLQDAIQTLPTKKERSTVERQICRSTTLSYRKFQRDAAIGRYVLTQKDPTLFSMPKSKVEALFLPPPTPKTPKVKPTTTNEVEFYKDVLRTMRDNMESRGVSWTKYCSKLGITPEALGL